MSGNVHHTTVDFFRVRLCVCVCLLVCAQYARVCVFAMADWAEKSAGWRVGEPPKLEGPTNQPPKPHLPAQLVRQTQEMRRTPNQSQTQTLQGINGKQCVVCQTTHLFPFIPCKIIKYIPRSWINGSWIVPIWIRSSRGGEQRRTSLSAMRGRGLRSLIKAWKRNRQMLVLVKSFWKSVLFREPV